MINSQDVHISPENCVRKVVCHVVDPLKEI